MADSELADSGKADSGRAEEPKVGSGAEESGIEAKAGEPTVEEPAAGKSVAGESVAGESVAGESPPDQEPAESVESQDQAGEVPEQVWSAEEEQTEPENAEASEYADAPENTDTPENTEVLENAEAEDALATQRNHGKKGLLIGLGTGVLVGIIAAGAFTWLAKPAFLVGPGAPDGKSSEVTMALAGKNADGVAKATCHGPDGQLSQQLPQQALQLIQAAKPTGPPQLSLDTEAITPVNLTITEQGQTQTVPVEIVLGVTKGQWCMKGIEQQQQQ